jgi:hypothetical protein
MAKHYGILSGDQFLFGVDMPGSMRLHVIASSAESAVKLVKADYQGAIRHGQAVFSQYHKGPGPYIRFSFYGEKDGDITLGEEYGAYIREKKSALGKKSSRFKSLEVCPRCNGLFDECSCPREEGDVLLLGPTEPAGPPRLRYREPEDEVWIVDEVEHADDFLEDDPDFLREEE